MDKQEENMSNTNDTIESKQKSEMTKKVRSGEKTCLLYTSDAADE